MNIILSRNFRLIAKIFAICSFALNCLYASAASAQNQACIIVSESYDNAKVLTKYSVDYQQRLFFYYDGKELQFSNEWTKSKSRSYGSISNIKIKKVADQGMNSNIIQFKWAWKNTYDKETGIADVYIKTFNTLNGYNSRVVIITDKMNVLDYRGVLNGSIEELFIQYLSDSQKQQGHNHKVPATKRNNGAPSLKKSR